MKRLLIVLALLSIGITSLQAERKIVITNAFYGAGMDKVAYSSAKLAINLWLTKMTKTISGATSQILFYIDFSQLKKDTQEKGKIDTLITSSYAYMLHPDFYKKYFNKGWIKTESDGKPFLSYVILKRKNTQVKKNSIAHYYKYSKISKIVIQKYSMEHNLNLRYESTKKESKPALDLFFKKCDVAIVNEFSWKLMQELNPQLSHSLVAIHKTDRIFTPVFSLFSRKMEEKKKKLYLGAIKDIGISESGKQLMQIFKFNKLIKLNNSSLNKIEKFYKNFLALKKKYEK